MWDPLATLISILSLFTSSFFCYEKRRIPLEISKLGGVRYKQCAGGGGGVGQFGLARLVKSIILGDYYVQLLYTIF